MLRIPWIGWAILLAILQVIHLFAPINRTTAMALVVACGVVAAIAVAIRVRARPNRTLTSIRTGNRWLIAAAGIASLLAFFPVFNACTKEMILYDLGLYYLKAVRWIATYSDHARPGKRARTSRVQPVGIFVHRIVGCYPAGTLGNLHRRRDSSLAWVSIGLIRAVLPRTSRVREARISPVHHCGIRLFAACMDLRLPQRKPLQRLAESDRCLCDDSSCSWFLPASCLAPTSKARTLAKSW